MDQLDRAPEETGAPVRLVGGWLAAVRQCAGPLTDPVTVLPLAHRLARLTLSGLAGTGAAERAGSRIADLMIHERLDSATALREAVLVVSRADELVSAPPPDAGDPAGSATPDPCRVATRREAVARMTAALAVGHPGAVLPVDPGQARRAAARDGADRARREVLPPPQGRTREEALEAELRHAATHDALTGLPNRALFLHRLDAALDGRGAADRIAVMFVDLDGFRFVNDSRGHVAGDQVLVATANRLAEVARANGALVARLAGDEFVVLLAGRADAVRPLAVADLLMAALDQPVELTGQRPVTVRASIGLAELPTSRSNARELLRAADLSLHAAKEGGRGQVVTHDPSRTARQLSRFTIATSLPGVVERGELALVYQRLTGLRTGELHGVEALLRWRHPRLGELTPRLFVGVAEETSLIVPMGRWVLRQALADLARAGWPAVNINVSVRQLLVPTFVDDVRRALAETGVAPARLRLEVTESIVMNPDEMAPLDALRALAGDGVRIVMDDFGTGYSNLAALRRLPLHELKLAGTFLEGLLQGGPPDPVDAAVLRTVVDLAHTLGLTVTAEEVATPAQDEHVRAIGCDIGQGWYYDDRDGEVPPPGATSGPSPG